MGCPVFEGDEALGVFVSGETGALEFERIEIQATGYQLWSERFDRELEDVFAVQDEIAAGVVEAVKARLAPRAALHARPQPRNVDAYRSYLLGQHLRYAKEDHGGAVRAFQEAVRIDPTHAPSWTGLAESLALSAHMSLIPAHEACTRAQEALSTAKELQGESADGLHGEGFVAFIQRRWKDLEAAVRRAVELQPSHVPSLGLLGMCLSLHQKPDEAAPFFERARQADPLASFPYMLTALGLLTVRRPREAHRHAEQALIFEKDDASALFCSGLANVALAKGARLFRNSPVTTHAKDGQKYKLTTPQGTLTANAVIIACLLYTSDAADDN